MNKGFLNVAIFNIVVKEHPIHGYRIMELIEEKTGYKPSPGSVYPILNNLVSQGYLRFETRGKRKLYFPTESGLKVHAEFENKRRELIGNYRSFSEAVLKLMGRKVAEQSFNEIPIHYKLPTPVRKSLFKAMNTFKETNWKSKESIERLVKQFKTLIDTLEIMKAGVNEDEHH